MPKVIMTSQDKLSVAPEITDFVKSVSPSLLLLMAPSQFPAFGYGQRQWCQPKQLINFEMSSRRLLSVCCSSRSIRPTRVDYPECFPQCKYQQRASFNFGTIAWGNVLYTLNNAIVIAPLLKVFDDKVLTGYKCRRSHGLGNNSSSH